MGLSKIWIQLRHPTTGPRTEAHSDLWLKHYAKTTNRFGSFFPWTNRHFPTILHGCCECAFSMDEEKTSQRLAACLTPCCDSCALTPQNLECKRKIFSHKGVPLLPFMIGDSQTCGRRGSTMLGPDKSFRNPYGSRPAKRWASLVTFGQLACEDPESKWVTTVQIHLKGGDKPDIFFKNAWSQEATKKWSWFKWIRFTGPPLLRSTLAFCLLFMRTEETMVPMSVRHGRLPTDTQPFPIHHMYPASRAIRTEPCSIPGVAINALHPSTFVTFTTLKPVYELHCACSSQWKGSASSEETQNVQEMGNRKAVSAPFCQILEAHLQNLAIPTIAMNQNDLCFAHLVKSKFCKRKETWFWVTRFAADITTRTLHFHFQNSAKKPPSLTYWMPNQKKKFSDSLVEKYVSSHFVQRPNDFEQIKQPFTFDCQISTP